MDANVMKLQEHKKQGFSIIFFNYGHEKISISNFSIQNLTSKLAYYGLFSHLYFIKKERKKSITPLFNVLCK
jgi:hypothetical protein